jgi:D-alanine-D-alanine ligase
VRVFKDQRVEIIFIEVNSLPGMTPATCIFHQAAINNYKPYEFIDHILDFGKARLDKVLE